MVKLIPTFIQINSIGLNKAQNYKYQKIYQYKGNNSYWL